MVSDATGDLMSMVLNSFFEGPVLVSPMHSTVQMWAGHF